ncbi:MAG: hypothetical protein JO186_05260 [Actinobacteria bacterium]|nr:hypothetical protein [Actinomycetota bacterium]
MDNERHPKGISALLPILVALALCGIGASGAGASRSAIGTLKLCSYYTVNDATTTANIKLLAAGAAGMHGAFVLKGNAANMTVHFTVRSNGTAFTSFPVANGGGERVTATLGAKSRAVNLDLPAGTNVKQQKGCVPQ